MSMTWMKFAHVEFLLSPDMLGLSLQSQGALLRLMAHAARQTPYGSLPDDFDLIGRMVGKGWNKRIQQELFNGVFVANEDGRWTCPLMTDVWADALKADVTPIATTKRSASAERVARMRQRNRNTVTPNVTQNVTPQSVTCNADVTQNVTPQSVTCNADVTQNVTPVTVTIVTNGGIKGGDLDQDLDLDQEVKNTQTNVRVQVRENFSPKIEDLNTRLKMAGGTAIDQKTLDQTLVTFVPHYETQFLTDNQLLGKLVQWVKRDQDKPKFAPSKAKKSDGDVNSKFAHHAKHVPIADPTFTREAYLSECDELGII